MGSGPGYPSACALARECEAKIPPNAGTKLSREKDPVFPQKACQTNFSHFRRQAKILKNYYPLSKNGPEKFIPLKPCCPRECWFLVLFLFFFLFISFLFSFFLFSSALAETSYS